MMTKEDQRMLSRRKILKGAGIGVATGVVAALGMPAKASAADNKQHWDQETDIVCVGSGAAGCAAAVTAVDRGNKVIILERAPIMGGTTLKSGGVLWVPNHFLLRAKGIKDDKDDCLRYMGRYAYPQTYTPNSPTLGLDPREYRLLEAYYDNGSAMVDRMREIGAAQFEEFVVGPDKIAPPDYGQLAENKLSKGRAICPAGKQGDPGGGSGLIGDLEAWLTKKGVTMLTEHRVIGLVEEKGRIVGVEAQSGDKIVRIRARKAVIFGTGGYSHNTDLVGLHQTALYGACASLGSTGDFISIGGAAGARMGNLGSAWRSQVVLEQALENRALGLCVFVPPGDSMIIVNKQGRRVVNEKADYNDRTSIHFTYDSGKLEYPNQVLMMVFDRRTIDAFAGVFPLPQLGQKAAYIIEGADLKQLAANIQARLKLIEDKTGGVSLASDFADTLKATVKRYDGFARAGKDDDFHRGQHDYDHVWRHWFSAMRDGSKWPANKKPESTMYPFQESGPYYAIILGAGALDTNGGPLINEKGQVLGVDDKPIPGLYGAGNCIASPARAAYFGAGGTIGLAMTYGFIAANHASQEPGKEA